MKKYIVLNGTLLDAVSLTLVLLELNQSFRK